MKSRTVLGILLLLSMVLVLYPPVSTLIEAQNLILRYGANSAAIEARDNLVLQIVGFVLLYLVLAFGFNFIRFEQQETLVELQRSEPIRSQQAVQQKIPRVVEPLASKTQNSIVALFASVFLLVFVWQVFSNISSLGTDFNTIMFFLEQGMKGVIACLIVGIVAYIAAKRALRSH